MKTHRADCLQYICTCDELVMKEALRKADELHEFEIEKYREVIETLSAENARYREALELCIARAGFTDAPEACRLVIDTAREALKGE